MSNPISKEVQEKLFAKAIAAKDTSYSPYSKFRVGAALLTEDGTIYQGCNIENASFGAGICAERTAYVKAISEGHNKFVALAVTTDQDDFVSPCGICRQFISEFGPATLPVYLLKTSGESQLLTLADLLPYSFGLEQGQKYILK
ncbi:cytidine deaminase [Lichtheimia ornata]|uniref:Cytidine deaminase n=1 Tax=Lichtheimia ornata TaxID=688661 RepID=A0AAD7UZ05_9FUNG|nr:cytidine deaminase [Lichtheimia ornata]KAJ8656067.1 cytidine deaminase [Lichtheimia ornata]